LAAVREGGGTDETSSSRKISTPQGGGRSPSVHALSKKVPDSYGRGQKIRVQFLDAFRRGKNTLSYLFNYIVPAPGINEGEKREEGRRPKVARRIFLKTEVKERGVLRGK